MIYEEELEIFYQLRSNMKTLDEMVSDKVEQSKERGKKSRGTLTDADTPAFENALENLVDAYIAFDRGHKCGLERVAGELKETTAKRILHNTETKDGHISPGLKSRLEGLQAMTAAEAPAILSGAEIQEPLEAAVKALQFYEQVTAEAAALAETTVKADERRIEALLKTADKLADKQKKETSRQKSLNSKQEKLRAFALEECRLRLEKRAQRSDEEEYVYKHLDEISRIVMAEDGGKSYLLAETANGAGVKIPFKSYKKYYVFGNTPADLDKKGKVTELFNHLQDGGELGFAAANTQMQGGSSSMDKAKFAKLMKLKGLEDRQMTAAAAELKAYNVLKEAGQSAQAEELWNKLQEKYELLTKENRLNKLREKKTKLQQIIGINAKSLGQELSTRIKAADSREFISLCAPGRGNNRDEEAKRQEFEKFLQLAGDDRLPVMIRTDIMESCKNDGLLWMCVGSEFYKKVKQKAAESYFMTAAGQLVEGKTTPAEIEADNRSRFSPKLLQMILRRSVTVAGLSGIKIKGTQRMDEVLAQLGCAVRRKEFTVEQVNGLRSKPLTQMLRCLARGRPFEWDSPEGKIDARDRKHIQDNYDKYYSALGGDANFQPLVGNIIKGKPAGEAAALSPYEKRYKTIGLMAALAPVMDKDIVDNEIFAQVQGVPSGSISESQKRKSGWNKDNYLFDVYMNIYFDKKAAAGSQEKLEQMKADYGWEEFKRSNLLTAGQVAGEFIKEAQNPARLTAVLLAQGRWPDNNATLHHNDPLKYAVCSADPASFNRQEKLVAAVTWRPWEEDKHQCEHLATLETPEALAPYLVKEGENYRRCPQCDLREGMTVCAEKAQIMDKKGLSRDLIADNTMLITSSGLTVFSPKVPEKALEFAQSRQQISVIELAAKKEKIRGLG